MNVKNNSFVWIKPIPKNQISNIFFLLQEQLWICVMTRENIFFQKLLFQFCLLVVCVINQCKSDLTSKQTKPLKYTQDHHFHKNSKNHHSEEDLFHKTFKEITQLGLQDEVGTKILQHFCLNRTLEGEWKLFNGFIHNSIRYVLYIAEGYENSLAAVIVVYNLY